jgi:hypothetical protein
MAYIGNKPAELAVDIDNASVTTEKLANDAVTAAKIVDGTIIADDLNNGIITNSKVASNAAIAATKLAVSGGSNITLQSDGTFDLDASVDVSTGYSVGGNAIVDSSRNATFTTVGTPAGSAAAPAYTFSTDTNTGMFKRGTDQIGFSAGGTEMLALTSTGIFADKLGNKSTGSDLTLDVAGEINLDADGAVVNFQDGGTTFGLVTQSSSDFVVRNPTLDKDIVFKGNDGGVTTTALTLDMSQAGRATFNEGIVLKSSTAGNFGVNINTLSGDSMKLQVVDTGSAGAANGVITVTDGDLILSPSANVGIGTTLPSTRLTVGAGVSSEEIRVDAGAGWADLTLNSNATNGGHIYFNDGSNAGEIFYYHVSDYMAFNTAGAEAMRIGSDGAVTLKPTGITTGLRLQGRSSDNNFYVQFKSNDGNTTYSAIGTSSADTALLYQSNVHKFQNTASNNTYMTLDASGRLLVGTNSISMTGAGFRVYPNDFTGITTTSSDAGDRALLLNRQNSDGVHLEFKKANAAVGGIGNASGTQVIYLSGNQNAVKLVGPVSGVDSLGPSSTSGGNRDNAMDLGWSSNRFKDLYLSNRVITPTVASPDGTGILTLNNNGGGYFSRGIVVNEDGYDFDFRVESDANAYAMFLDASYSSTVCFGTNNINLHNSNTAGVNIGGNGNVGQIIASTYENRPLILHRGGNNGQIIEFGAQTSTVGSVDVTTSGTTYNTTSDRRLKTDIQPIADATDMLMAMNPVKHGWKADPHTGETVHGFIAQEMKEIVPEAVSGDPDGEEMMSMDYGRITPVLVAALQDAMKDITALKERVAELEAK